MKTQVASKIWVQKHKNNNLTVLSVEKYTGGIHRERKE